MKITDESKPNEVSAVFDGRFIVSGPIDTTGGYYSGQRVYAVQMTQ
jgi:hypothetical protein